MQLHEIEAFIAHVHAEYPHGVHWTHTDGDTYHVIVIKEEPK